jgi:glycosyltransferase involved in cell wall biosynthesis
MVINYPEVRNRLISITGMGKKLFHLVYNLNSLLTRRNVDRIITYLRLFGFRITFNEIIKKLWMDNYYLYTGDKSSSTIKTRLGPNNESISFHDSVISVVIPVKNAGDDLNNLLSMMRNQKGFKGIEIVVVDSGSTDHSIEMAKEFGSKIIRISPDEFSHSHSRNIGAKHAAGDYILFAVQDALPPSDSWLHELFSVILDEEVVAVSCAEMPREDADLFYKALSWSHNKFMEIERQDRIMTKPEIENHLAYKKNGQLNNVACLISKDVFMKYAFRGKYAEDLDLGIRLIRDGYKLAIIGSTAIIHSHKRPPYYYLKRGYIEHTYYSKLLPNFPVFAVNSEQLIRETAEIYGLLDSIVNVDLKEFRVPCNIKDLSRYVMNKLYRIGKNRCPDNIDLDSNSYLDNEFVGFLKALDIQTHYNQTNKLVCRGILRDNMQSYTALILEFLSNSVKTMDHHLLEEFKSSLFKAYAFIIGVTLASSFLQYSDSTNDFYRQIDNELQRQI